MLQEPRSTEILPDFHVKVLQALEHDDRPAICGIMRQVLYEAQLQFSLADDFEGLELINLARAHMDACVVGQAPERNLFELFRQIGNVLKENGEETDSFVCELLAKSYAEQACDYWPCFSPTVPDALFNGEPAADSADAELIDFYQWVSTNAKPAPPPPTDNCDHRASNPGLALKHADANRLVSLFPQ